MKTVNRFAGNLVKWLSGNPCPACLFISGTMKIMHAIRAVILNTIPAYGVMATGSEITRRGSVIIFGRSDATLNRDGVRIGTSEVYSAIDSIPELTDSIVVCIEKEGGQYFMPLFVVMKEREIT